MSGSNVVEMPQQVATEQQPKTLDGAAIVQAVEMMRQRHPTASVEIWAGYKDGQPTYTALIEFQGINSWGHGSRHGQDPVACATAALEEASKAPDLRQEKIARLRDELAKLEAQQ